MTILDLIAEKEKELAVIKRQIRMLQRMVKEERFRLGVKPPRAAKTSNRGGARGVYPRQRAATGNAAADRVAAYLKAHAGPRRVGEIAQAIGMTRVQAANGLNQAVLTGRPVVRGKDRGTYLAAKAKAAKAKA